MKSAAIAILLGALTACGAPGLPPPLPDREGLVVQGVHYVGLVVSDLEEATAFYSAPADLQTGHEAVLRDDPAVDTLTGRVDTAVRTRLLRSVNAQLRLMQFESPSEQARAAPPEQIQGPGYSHVCFQAAQETAVHGRFLTGGGRPLGIREMVQLSSRNPVEYAYLRDPDETIIEVEHVDLSAFDEDELPANKYRIRHVAIATPDVDRAAAFYSVLLEEPDPRRVGGSKGFSGDKVDQLSGLTDARIRMAWFQIRNLEFEIGQYTSHPTKTPLQPRPVDALGYNMVVFDVSDIAAARAKLLEAGGTVVTDVQVLDGGEMFFGRDPDLNLLGFQVLPDNSPLSAKNFKDNGAG